MNENDKNFYENTESPYELFKAAQRDIMNISNTIESKRFSPEDNIETICRCAAESVEKMLKGWIINKNENTKIYGIHGYSSPFTIEKHEVKECLKNLKYIYDFQKIIFFPHIYSIIII